MSRCETRRCTFHRSRGHAFLDHRRAAGRTGRPSRPHRRRPHRRRRRAGGRGREAAASCRCGGAGGRTRVGVSSEPMHGTRPRRLRRSCLRPLLRQGAVAVRAVRRSASPPPAYAAALVGGPAAAAGRPPPPPPPRPEGAGRGSVSTPTTITSVAPSRSPAAAAAFKFIAQGPPGTTPPQPPPGSAGAGGGGVTPPPRPQPRAAGNSPIWQFEDPISTCNSMITMKVLVIRRASANSPSQPHVLGEDCDALGVDGAQHRVFEKLNNKSLRCFLECQQGLCLKTDIALEILAEFSHQTLKWPHP